jgi:nitroimidazol reductase NimA-like FMN-containing flavoprotein (pyridoxamine 5'-phosphate oxidase superfamily)
MTLHRELTEAEWEDFIKSNRHGILAFGGDQPYALPVPE